MTESPVPERKFEIKSLPVLTMLSLNEIFRESMQAVYPNPDLIVRCEPLPLVNGNREDLLRLFGLLTGMILEQPTAGTRLFIHLRCGEDLRDYFIEPGFKKYLIKFYTNFTTTDTWKELHMKQLSESEKIIHSHKGKFQVNNISNTGCLFAISLPGKFA